MTKIDIDEISRPHLASIKGATSSLLSTCSEFSKDVESLPVVAESG